jgi:hypothetical protein
MMKELLLALWIAQGADMATTVVGINRGCVEMNPLYKSRSVPAMIAIKGGATFTIGWAAGRERKKGNTRRSNIIVWTAIVAGAGAAVWNVHVIPQC